MSSENIAENSRNSQKAEKMQKRAKKAHKLQKKKCLKVKNIQNMTKTAKKCQQVEFYSGGQNIVWSDMNIFVWKLSKIAAQKKVFFSHFFHFWGTI